VITYQITLDAELILPPIRALLERGLKDVGSPEVDLGVDTVLMTFDDDFNPKAFVIIALPVFSHDQNVPQIVHFYSEGPRQLTRHLVTETLDFIKEKGYNLLRAVNQSGAPDAVWERVFRHPEWEIKPVATVFDFKVKA
jgi:hypothetical protein